MRTIDGQAWCSFCGAAYSEPMHSRVFRIDGERVRVVYPERIEYHDIIPRSHGGDPEDLENQCPLCVECHTKHHSQGGMRLTFLPDRIVRADGVTRTLEARHRPAASA